MNSIKWLRNSVEVVLLLGTAIVSIVVPLLDLAGLLDANSWIVQRIPTLTLLGVGFLAGYVIMERRGKLDEIAAMLDERSLSILQTFGVETEQYATSGEWSSAMAARVSKAQRIDDVSWIEERDVQYRWSQTDREAHKKNDAAIDKVIRDPKVTWREICIFYPDEPYRFEREKRYIQDRKAAGYSLGYFETPPIDTPPRIGGFLIADSDTQDGEVFISSADSTIWLSIKHPMIVGYFANYFDSLWKRAKKLKVGQTVDSQLLERLEEGLRSKQSAD